ncbi:MAG: DegT/DnrJ/EryC1/StrS family aminotransferase [Verrucomicrobia bacterium]|nr:DegT/DnrJ/EryC1/StrS family aminotransferase [Verrucomicrobiota bacterium]
MNKPIPWWSPQLAGTEQHLIAEVLASNYLNDGEVTSRFECEVAALVGAKHAVAVTSGTTALFLALAALGVGPGDEVIVPDITFIATANAVKLAGATPVLVDVDPLTLNICPRQIAEAITPRTKAIMPVHVSGRAADLPAIRRVAEAHNLFVVEDAAEALLSRLDGKCLGTIGAAGCLSFSPNKTITTGQGGMVLTNDDALHTRLRELKDHGRRGRGTGGDDVHHAVGFNFKLTNLQAAVGLAQLDALPERIERQKKIFSIYAVELADCEPITLPGFDLAAGEVPQWTDALVEDRDALVEFLEARQIFCRRFWFPLHTQTPYRATNDRFPNSTRLGPNALWLPSAFTLTDGDVLTVCRAVVEWAAQPSRSDSGAKAHRTMTPLPKRAIAKIAA